MHSDSPVKTDLLYPMCPSHSFDKDCTIALTATIAGGFRVSHRPLICVVEILMVVNVRVCCWWEFQETCIPVTTNPDTF